MEMGSFIQQVMQSWRCHNKMSDLQQALSQQAASFIDLCDSREPSMTAIIDELQQISANVKRSRQELVIAIFAGIFVLAVVVFGAISHAEKLRFPDLNTDAYLILFVTVMNLARLFFEKPMTVELENAPKMNRSMKEFGVIVADLRNCLEAVKSICEHLRVLSDGSEALKFIRLEIKILELFSITATLRTFTLIFCNTKISEKYKMAADEFVKMKSELRKFCIQEGAENRL